MTNNKIDKAYVSEIDQFLQEFDQSHPDKSASQQKEIAKHQRVYRLRDEAKSPEENNRKELWDKF